MYVHFEKKLSFLMHPRTASRAIATVLEARGFISVGRHHDGPNNIEYRKSFKQPDHDLIVDKWNKSSGFHYSCVVRNPFDTLLTWFYKTGEYKKVVLHGNKREKITIFDFVKSWPIDVTYFPVKGQLWKFIWDIPDIEILYYENLREDLNSYLIKNNFLGLTEDEFGVDKLHVTLNKPEDWYSQWSPEAIEYVHNLYCDEFKKLNSYSNIL